MLLAKVIGQATSTIRHDSMRGQKLLVALELTKAGELTGDPVLVVDQIGAGAGDTVMISSDGAGVAERLNDESTPVRWFTLGMVD